MRRTTFVFYLAVLITGLGLAYLAWVQGPRRPGERVPVFHCKKGEIQRLVFEGKDLTVDVFQRKGLDSGEVSWWVETSRAPAPSGKEEAGEAPTAGATGKRVHEVFRASQRIEKVFERFCPWQALRLLGRVGEEKREEFGLADSKESLRIELPSGMRVFRIGRTTYGPRDRYVEDPETGKAFVVPGRDIQDLLHAKSRFMERSLYGFEQKEVTRIRIRAQSKDKKFARRPGGKVGEGGWADARHPQETKDLYQNWIRKLFRLRLIDYVYPPGGLDASPGCRPPEGSTEELDLTFSGPSGALGRLRIFKGADGKGNPVYYACSDHTEIVVKVPKSQAEGLISDLEDVLSED